MPKCPTCGGHVDWIEIENERLGTSCRVADDCPRCMPHAIYLPDPDIIVNPTSPSPDPVVVRLERENESLTARLAAAEARNATGTCRILSGECDCTLCKQDTKIAELSGKVGELEKLVKRLTEESLQSSIRNGAIIADFEDAVEYMVHLTECDIHDYPTSRGCTCGLEELRKRLAAAKAKGGRDE